MKMGKFQVTRFDMYPTYTGNSHSCSLSSSSKAFNIELACMLPYSLLERSQDMVFCLTAGKVQPTQKAKRKWCLQSAADTNQTSALIGYLEHRGYGYREHIPQILHQHSQGYFGPPDWWWISLRTFHRRTFPPLCNCLCFKLQNRQINVTSYKEWCTSLYLKLVTKFKWAVIFPSLHRVLYHSLGSNWSK